MFSNAIKGKDFSADEDQWPKVLQQKTDWCWCNRFNSGYKYLETLNQNVNMNSFYKLLFEYHFSNFSDLSRKHDQTLDMSR